MARMPGSTLPRGKQGGLLKHECQRLPLIQFTKVNKGAGSDTQTQTHGRCGANLNTWCEPLHLSPVNKELL